MHYVIGDVHGCYDEFTILRKKIEKRDPDAVIILTGDLIDRGPKVWDMLRWAMKNVTEDGKYQCICGNHEDMVISWYYDWVEWYSQENRKAFARPKTSYGFDEVLRENGCDTPEKAQPIIEFFQTLPFRKEIYVPAADGGEILFDIVHGADTFEEGVDEEYRRELNLWGRDGSIVDERTIVVHGHTPTMAYDYLVLDTQVNRPGMIGYQKQDINLDGGCCFSDISNSPCFLCAICLETMEEFYPRTIWSQLLRQEKFTTNRKDAMQAEREFLVKYPWKENMHRLIMLDMLGIEEKESEPDEDEEEIPEELFIEDAELTESEPEAEIKNEAKPEAEPKAKTEAKPETEPKAKTEAKPETEPKAKTEAKPETEPKAKTEAKPETEPKAKTEAKQETEPKAKTEAKPEAEQKAKTEAKPETEPKTKTEAKPETEPKAKIEPKPKQPQGSKPSQNQGGKPSQNQGGKPNQNQGGKPSQNQGGKPNQNQGGKPKQNQGGKPKSKSKSKSKKRK